MGAKASSEFGQIHVNIDKPSYFQGEYVYGSVFLNLLKDFPGNELFVKMKGKEEARWTEGSGKNKSHYHGKKIIISHQFPLYKFPTSHIPAGQYNFPFSVFVPANLPASFANSGLYAVVSYKIKGEVRINDKNYKHFRSSKELKVKQSKNEDFAPIYRQLKVDVDICCCFGQGYTNIETQVNKTFFYEGELADIQCTVDNSHCELPLTTVEMQVVRRLVVKSDWGHQNTSNYRILSQIQRLNLPARSASPSKVMFQMKMSSNNNVKLLSTSQGDIVKNNYFITIYPRYESFMCNCCVKSCETPILIYDPKDQDLNPMPVQAPENWSPQMMPVQNFDWKTAQMYQGRNAGGYNYPSLDVQNQMLQQNVPFQPNFDYNYNPYVANPNNNNIDNNMAMNYNNDAKDMEMNNNNFNNNNGNYGMNYNQNQNNILNDSTGQALKQPLYGEGYDEYGFPKDPNK